MAYIPNSGSIVAFQSDPTKLQVTTAIAGSVITVLPANQSVSGTVGASLVGQLPTGTAMIGSVVAYQGVKPWDMAGSVAAVVTNNVTVVSSIAGGIFPISGSVAAVVTNNVTVVSSLAGGIFPVSGSVSAVVTNLQGASVSGTVLVNNGSVVAFQGTSPWIVNFQNSSIIGVNSGSVVTISQGSVITVFQNSSLLSVQAGTAISSVISSNPSSLLTGNYAQRNDNTSSFLGGNLTWNPLSTDSAGRSIIKPFSSEDGTIINYVGSIVSGSVQLIQASAIGKKSYVTDFWLSNTGSVATLVTFQGGDTSLVGQFIAPAGGGMSSPGIAIPLKTTLSQDLAFKVSTASSVLYLTLKGYQAP